MAGKDAGAEACKWKGGERKEEEEKEKRALTVISDFPSLSTPLPPPRTTSFLTALARVMVLIHAQKSVHKFIKIFFRT